MDERKNNERMRLFYMRGVNTWGTRLSSPHGGAAIRDEDFIGAHGLS